MHAREMIYRSFSKSNATRKEKKEWSHLHQEFNKKFHDIEDFSSTKIKKRKGRGNLKSHWITSSKFFHLQVQSPIIDGLKHKIYH